MRIENIFRDSIPRTVIGVVNNYHFRSLKEKINPLVISITSNHYVGIMKFKTHDLQKLVADLTREWNLYANGFPFAFNFLDDQIEQLYRDEKNQSHLFLIFCSLAIFIACMGLFALSILTAEKRLKEMAIRKIHGARVSQIVAKLNFEFIILILISTLIMIPFGWYVMNKWLQNFEYHIEIGWLYFLGTAIFVIMLSLITVSYKAFKVAGSNPANVLRYE
jgi:putative ABC transport system permease protein